MYQDDLALFPRNPWSLAGLRLCYDALADPRLAEVESALREADKGADIRVGASCACALKAWGKR